MTPYNNLSLHGLVYENSDSDQPPLQPCLGVKGYIMRTVLVLYIFYLFIPFSVALLLHSNDSISYIVTLLK